MRVQIPRRVPCSMKKKWLFLVLIVVIILVGGGFLVYKYAFKDKKSNSSEGGNSNNPPNNPNGKLSQEELEKYLLEKRLDLQKYFVFNLGELKTLSQANTQTKNVRITNSNLGSDLYELTNHAFKHLEKQGYKMQGVKVGKRRISFLKDAENDIATVDNKWNDHLDQKITDSNLYIIFEKEKNYDWPNAWFQVWKYTDSDKKYLVWTSDFQLRIKNSATTICENKEKALEIIKTDPALSGRV